jgi:hypothetical protein
MLRSPPSTVRATPRWRAAAVLSPYSSTAHRPGGHLLVEHQVRRARHQTLRASTSASNASASTANAAPPVLASVHCQ